MEKTYIVLDRKDAMDNAWTFSTPIFRKSNKIPMKRTEFVHYADLLYMMGASNAVKDIYHYLKANPESDFEVLLGEIQIIMTKAWNNMLDNPIGAKTVKKMEIEDILNEVSYQKLFVKPQK